MQLYIYIYKRIHTTKQNKSNLTITQNTQLQSENQREKKIPTTTKLQSKVQNPQIQYKNKNKNYKPSNNTYRKIHKSNQRAKGGKQLHISYTNHHKSIGAKKNLRAALPIVGTVGSGEFK
jgi:hypothetical protein